MTLQKIAYSWNIIDKSTSTHALLLNNNDEKDGFCAFFCVHDIAATRGQYLALSKAWHYLFKLEIVTIK